MTPALQIEKRRAKRRRRKAEEGLIGNRRRRRSVRKRRSNSGGGSARAATRDRPTHVGVGAKRTAPPPRRGARRWRDGAGTKRRPPSAHHLRRLRQPVRRRRERPSPNPPSSAADRRLSAPAVQNGRFGRGGRGRPRSECRHLSSRQDAGARLRLARRAAVADRTLASPATQKRQRRSTAGDADARSDDDVGSLPAVAALADPHGPAREQRAVLRTARCRALRQLAWTGAEVAVARRARAGRAATRSIPARAVCAARESAPLRRRRPARRRR